MSKFTFCEIRRNKFGRRWAIKEGRKIIHKGYDFSFGRKLFDDLSPKEDRRGED